MLAALQIMIDMDTNPPMVVAIQENPTPESVDFAWACLRYLRIGEGPKTENDWKPLAEAERAYSRRRKMGVLR